MNLTKYKYNDKLYDSINEIRQESGLLFSDTPSKEVMKEIGIEIVLVPMTEAQQKLAAKLERVGLISQIRVEIDGMTFQGDYVSQGNMAVQILVMNDKETVKWILADNTVKDVTKDQLLRALKLAKDKSNPLQISPYIENNKG